MVCVVVGVSAAGINAAKTLREIDKNIEIILVSIPITSTPFTHFILYVSKKFSGVKSKDFISLLPSKK